MTFYKKSNYQKYRCNWRLGILSDIFVALLAICALVGVSTFAVASAMDQALYFPEDLPPTWARSWAEVGLLECLYFE